jgi:hypothetical protein
MGSGEFLTRGTIWLSILAYVVGSLTFTISRGRSTVDSVTRLIWTIAVAALVAHYIFAFQFYHGWSHDAAYSETARQTAEVFVINWGGGLFINYTVLMLWMGDIGWWWVGGLNSYRSRKPWSAVVVWHAFLIFIIFNATVVFKDGPVRWLGVAICVCVSLSWLLINRSRTELARVSHWERTGLAGK